MAEAEALAQADRSAPTGRFVVAAPSVFGRLHVAPVMRTYLERYPAVTGELQLADRTVNLVEKSIDLALRIGHLADSTLVARRVGHSRRVVVGSPGYLEQRGTPRRPEALAGHALIQFSAVTPLAEWRFIRDGSELRVALAPRLVTNSADAAIGHAERGGGLATAGTLPWVTRAPKTTSPPAANTWRTSRALRLTSFAWIG